MNDDQLDALVDAAADGVCCDGLTVRRPADGYAWETPIEEETGLSEAELRQRSRASPELVTNWHFWTTHVGNPESARYAFLRWLERADETPVPERYDRLATGIQRSWGQLLVTARMGVDGRRRYDLRHRDDRDREREELDEYHDPAAARHLSRFDADGGYRPLPTAPTLRSGWVFPDLSPEELVRAVEHFYPATVANWHLEHEGALDVTHWRDTADRQTGMYDLVDELPREAIEWAAHACCVDASCLKRRRWEFDEDRELDVPAGAGEFPCREACSLFVAAAREWALAERETTQAYEFELTPGEKAQLEAIVAAVAEDELEDVREGALDDPANRYRVRYLYAKLFEDGEFDDEVVSAVEDVEAGDEGR